MNVPSVALRATTSIDGLVLSADEALAARLGVDVSDLVGRRLDSFAGSPDAAATLLASLRSVVVDDAPTQVRIGLTSADGRAIDARVVVTPGSGDDLTVLVIDETDDTEIAHPEPDAARHRLGESWFRARFDQSHLPQVMLVWDGTFEAVNDAFCTLVGQSHDELLKLHFTDILHPDDPGEALRVSVDLQQGLAEQAQVDGLLQDAAGQPVPVRIDATLLRDADGAPTGSAVSLQDLRPLRDSELARADLQSLFDVVAARSRDFIALHDADGRALYASPVGADMFGEGVRANARDTIELVHPDDLDEATRQWRAVQSDRESRTWRFRARSSTGSWMWLEQTATNLLDTRLGAVVSIVRDVTDVVEASEAQRLSEAGYRAIAETAEEGILVIAPGGVVTFANARAATITGLPLLDIVGHHLWEALEGHTAERVAEMIRERRVRGPERYEVPYWHPDGTSMALRISASPMPDVDGQEQGSLAMISDITEQRRIEQDLRHAAEHDELTGLLNRSMMVTQLDRRLTDGTAVLFIDLDHFKDINDGSGHTVGDAVLVEVARRLRAALRADDLIARFGGDEFVVVLDQVDEGMAMVTARRLLDVLSKSYQFDHLTLRVGATIGVALSPAESADHLLRFADTAMYAAKSSGRGRVRLFDDLLAAQVEERYSVGTELLTALTTDALEMHYQPVVDVVTGEVAGVEALVRWDHPTRGPIPPSRFVALAELSASSADLDRWVVRRAMRDIAELKADWTMPEAATVAINLSGQSLAEGLDAFIIDCAREAGLEPAGVTLEITESAIMTDKDVAIAVLQRLREHGFGIAIDDFGTGYSSMAYLRDLPITVLKIDRGFVRGIPDDSHSLAIVTSLIELARSLGLTVVAEGVEAPAQLQALRDRGCNLAQGWLWSTALSPHALKEREIFRQQFETDTTPD